ncbi:MAG: 50S ribosomal protein L6 [candidate division WS2 bacterium ADurb.Bin280]|uniref:Large ribosomal subunit protein uL6 n=1 Tax=candidate division WS2 bacterium ADurb.Bin280 TaxID=1852829 RepID=A0A1V5SEN7_9BACT|nr:MAG: 50S ribosomal protein L6 [candidate division WS2 bacterium ADurb.Bin280]
MSKIGRKSIEIPENVTVEANKDFVVAKGELGELRVDLNDKIKVQVSDKEVLVSRKDEEKISKSLHGTIRSLIANAVHGVSKGFEKTLEIVGVGYRAQIEGDKLILKLGFSHDIEFPIPQDVAIEVKKNTIIIKGIDKQRVGQVSAEIRAYKKPEPYKGKGIKYSDEKIIRKAGKAVKGAASGA